MSTLRFSAHCERGHDPLDFTDPKAFEAHMKGEHKARKRSGGGPAWCSPKPYPWVAPKAPATTEKLTAVLLKAAGREYAFRGDRGWDFLADEWHTDDVVSTADLEPGDVFVAAVATGVRYTVLDTDPEKGWHLELVGDHSQAGSAKRGWLRELKLPRAGVLETVIRVGRAA